MPALDMLELFDPVADHPLVRMVSLMDHSPGRRPVRRSRLSIAALRAAGRAGREEIERRIVGVAGDSAHGCAIPTAAPCWTAWPAVTSRWPATTTGPRRRSPRMLADGIGISEFPVTMAAAARGASAAGMQVIAGAPNIVRGGSHSGNVSAADLVGDRRGRCVRLRLCAAQPGRGGVPMCAPDHVCRSAIALVTDQPARMAGLDDRGRMSAGQRADLVRVRLHDGLPVVRQVWRAGERVA